MKIGDKIKKRIEELGLSFEQAAKKCGIKKATLYSYAVNRSIPTIINLKKIAEGLNISIDELLKEEEDFEEIMKDPELKIMFEKVGQLTPEARKSILDFINFVYEQEKSKRKGKSGK